MDFVDNQLNVRTGTIRGRAVLDNNNGRFTPGLFARVQLLGSSEHEAILIEDRAVGTDQNQNYVLVLGAGNRLEYRPVQLGRAFEGLRIVRKGLKSGDVVVVNGLQRVRAGVQVTPKLVVMGTGSAGTQTAMTGAQ
jgi:multidrug efflux system membrane fusion protein